MKGHRKYGPEFISSSLQQIIFLKTKEIKPSLGENFHFTPSAETQTRSPSQSRFKLPQTHHSKTKERKMLLSLIASRSLTQGLSTNSDSEVSNPPLSPNPARRSAQGLRMNGDKVSDRPSSLNQLRRLAQDYSINGEAKNPPFRPSSSISPSVETTPATNPNTNNANAVRNAGDRYFHPGRPVRSPPRMSQSTNPRLGRASGPAVARTENDTAAPIQLGRATRTRPRILPRDNPTQGREFGQASRTVIDTAVPPTLAVPNLTVSHIYVSFHHSEDAPREHLVEYRYDQEQDRYVMYSPPSPQEQRAPNSPLDGFV